MGYQIVFDRTGYGGDGPTTMGMDDLREWALSLPAADHYHVQHFVTYGYVAGISKFISELARALREYPPPRSVAASCANLLTLARRNRKLNAVILRTDGDSH
jgi:hypothetical protein